MNINWILVLINKMLFIILIQLWAISMCLNPDQPNSNINLDNRTLSIFQIGGNSNIQNSQNLKKFGGFINLYR